MPLRHAGVTVALLSVFVGAVGCAGTGTVSVPAPEPAADAAGICRTLADALPGEVEERERREVEPSSPYTAAWGDPAIVLRCGVPDPAVLDPPDAAYDPFADAVAVNDVSWLIEAGANGDGYRFTTTERTVRVEVTVPSAYAPETGVLVDLAEAVAGSVPLDPLWEDHTDHG
ncbi:DUF3515 family protein [Streptomyces sp. ST2-7A]|uniref:DUF3515 family protein n=1 Tax=Streptomyces sp. ST2-7A TaxID=2907214 RepID=UPI001F22DBDA|nr:DUF3515 family protein [Streptomyces sp. ST2-7A]MCE7079918.1 DUF3515 domain-containing protein [Streptomyces sp. ST2-7A]